MSKEEIRDICMLLGRLRSDCEYYLYSTCGYRCPRVLWAHDEQKQIDKVIIIETKGEGFAAKFKDKLDFMSEFVKKNNDKFGYQRFDFLYLEDTITPEQRRQKTLAAINNFFNV